MELENSNIKLIVGLGNPGKEYKNTYHNIGFMCVDFLQKNLAPTQYKILKTDTYMNKSGKFVKEKIKNLNLKPENILIIHDDSDIQIGNYKLSFERGSAGHKGIKSIINNLGTKKFWRLRIGVRSEDESRKAEKFVTTDINHQQLENFEDVFWKIMNKLKDLES